MKKLILLCLIAYACVAHACPLITETPGQADQFVDSIGVNTHFGFGGSPYNGSANYTAIVLPTFESSGIRHAIVDEKPIRAGYVDVAVTRRVDVRATGCTCAVAAPCLCCRSFHAATVAREARQGALR